MLGKTNFKDIKRYSVIIILVISISMQMILKVNKITDDNYKNSNATYHVLLTMEAYDETPISVHKFLPIVSLGDETDKFIPWGATISDNNGNYYYTSFSPAGYIAPYLFMKLLHLPIDEMSLYIFNSLLAIICCMLSIILFRIIFKGKLSTFCIATFVTLIYLFQLEVMHSQGIVYWHQSLFQMLLLLQVVLFLRRNNKKAIVGFVLLCLINPYVEWTGYISNVGFAVAIFLKRFVNKIKHNKGSVRDIFLFPLIIVFVTCLSFGMFSFHYLLVVSGKQFWNALIQRFTVRNATKSSISILLMDYWESYGLFLILLGIMLIVVLGMKDTRKQFFINIKRDRFIWFILSFPLIENIILMQHAGAYSYDRLKGIFILIILFFTLFITLKNKFIHRTKFEWLVLIILFIIAFFNTFEYINYNTPYRWKSDYLNENMLFSNEVVTKYNGSNSILAQQQGVRGYNNFLFHRGIYEFTNDDNCVDLAYKNKKQFAIELYMEANETSIWNIDKYIGCRIYDLKENRVEIVCVDNGKILRDIKQSIIVSSVTDSNWTNGVSNNSATILLRNNLINRENIKEAKALKSSYVTKNIKDVEISGEWIQVCLEDSEEIKQFSSKSIVEIIK